MLTLLTIVLTIACLVLFLVMLEYRRQAKSWESESMVWLDRYHREKNDRALLQGKFDKYRFALNKFIEEGTHLGP